METKIIRDPAGNKYLATPFPCETCRTKYFKIVANAPHLPVEASALSRKVSAGSQTANGRFRSRETR